MTHNNIRKYMLLSKLLGSGGKGFLPFESVDYDEKTLEPTVSCKAEPGKSLKDFLKETKLDGKGKAALIENIIASVYVVHTQKILHRNLSTSTFYQHENQFAVWDFDNAVLNVGCRSFNGKPRNRFLLPTWNPNLPPEFYTAEVVPKVEEKLPDEKKDDKKDEKKPAKKVFRGNGKGKGKEVNEVKEVKEVKEEPVKEKPATRLYSYELDVWNVGLIIFEILSGSTLTEECKMTSEEINRHPDKFTVWLKAWADKNIKDLPNAPVYSIVLRQCLLPRDRNSIYGVKNICDIPPSALFDKHDADLEDKYEKKTKRTDFKDKFSSSFNFVLEDLATCMIHNLKGVITSKTVMDSSGRNNRAIGVELAQLVAEIKKQRPDGSAMRILCQIVQNMSGKVNNTTFAGNLWPYVQVAKTLADETYEVEYESTFGNFTAAAVGVLKNMISHHLYY